jgi:hypothetical protein
VCLHHASTAASSALTDEDDDLIDKPLYTDASRALWAKYVDESVASQQ